jgi:hypothetical protein
MVEKLQKDHVQNVAQECIGSCKMGKTLKQIDNEAKQKLRAIEKKELKANKGRSKELFGFALGKK